VCFEHDATFRHELDEVGLEKGTLIYSRGPCARENLQAVRSMPRPLARIWRESGDASTIVAFFTQRFLSRGTFRVEPGGWISGRGLFFHGRSSVRCAAR